MKRTLAFLLSLTMVLALVPVTAMAEDAALPAAAAPTNFRWDVYYWDGVETETKGCLTFDAVYNENYLVEFYLEAGDTDTLVTSQELFCFPFDTAVSANLFAHDLVEPVVSGDYYAVVTPLGDGSTTGEGTPVTSPLWSYTRPQQALTVSDPQWDEANRAAAWTNGFADESVVERYWVQYYCNPTEDNVAEAQYVAGQNYYPGDEPPYVLPDSILTTGGDGWYYFRIIAWTGDVTQATTADYTSLSAGLYLEAPDPVLSVTDPQWGEGMTMTWEDTSLQPEMVERYYVQFLCNPDEDNADEAQSVRYYNYYADKAPHVITDAALAEGGTGWYYFRVQARSSDVTVAPDSRWSEMSAGMYYAGPELEAPAASDLQWDVERYDSSDSWKTPGCISFAGAVAEGTEETEYLVRVYRQEADGDVEIGSLTAWFWYEDEYLTAYPFQEFGDQFTTGTYYYTVTPLGDGVTTGDGQPVQSPTWDYVRPDVTLEVSDPLWDEEMLLTWTDGQQNDGLVSYYEVQFWVNPDADDPAGADFACTRSYFSDELPAVPYYGALEWGGDGWYYVKVRALAEDINAAVHSNWTDLSGGFHYVRPEVTLTPTDLQWNEDTLEMSWSGIDSALVDSYRIRFYFSETNEVPSAHLRTRYFYPGDEPFTLPSSWLENYGPGYYWFSVQAFSAKPTRANTGGWSALSPVLAYAGPENQLGTPSDLQWHVAYNYDGTTVDRMGLAAFKRAEPDQARYNVWYYRVGESEPVAQHNWGFGNNSQSGYFDVSDFIYEDLPSGDYYFRVRALGDNVEYANGEWSEASPVWTYTAPEARLSVPTGLSWDDSGEDILMTWDAVEGAGYYEVEKFYASTPTGAKDGLGGNFDIQAWEEGNSIDLDEYDIADYGNGWYFFRVRAISPDITQIRNSDWSDYSVAYNLTDATTQANNALAAIDTTNATAADIQAAVQNVADTTKLDEALAADISNDDTVGLIAALEEATGIDTVVDAAAAPTGFDAAGVSIVGAALNADAGVTDKVTLTIGQSTAPDLIPTQYHNALQFSMNIEGAKDTDASTASLDLAVPVKITLPIPAGINPSFLVVLHYKESTGQWEELAWPHVYADENGQWYVTFVVDSMSPFALAQNKITAVAQEDGIYVEAYLPTAQNKDTKFLCAVYDGDGRMVGMTVIDPHTRHNFVELDQVTEDLTMKLFATDSGSGWTPVDQAREIEIIFPE